MLSLFIRSFPCWALLASIIAFFFPWLFTPFKDAIEPGLMLIMLCMGLTLTMRDFTRITQQPLPILAGVVLQFTVMPSTAIFVSWLLQLNDSATLGMILVSSVAGGTSSNVICYLAKADVALSITMTATSTLLGVFITPLLVDLLAGVRVDVPVLAMLLSLIKMVILPVSLGIVLNHFAPRLVKGIASGLPLLAMLIIIWVICIVIAVNADHLFTTGLIMLLAVVLHNAIGLFIGYSSCRIMGFDTTICRTVAIEVGIQNAGLAIAIALKFFTPIAAVSGALFSIWNIISGSIVAGFWSGRTAKQPTKIDTCNRSLTSD